MILRDARRMLVAMGFKDMGKDWLHPNGRVIYLPDKQRVYSYVARRIMKWYSEYGEGGN